MQCIVTCRKIHNLSTENNNQRDNKETKCNPEGAGVSVHGTRTETITAVIGPPGMFYHSMLLYSDMMWNMNVKT